VVRQYDKIWHGLSVVRNEDRDTIKGVETRREVGETAKTQEKSSTGPFPDSKPMFCSIPCAFSSCWWLFASKWMIKELTKVILTSQTVETLQPGSQD